MMRRKIIAFVSCVVLCFAGAFMFPHLVTSTYNVDDAFCMTCHNHDAFENAHTGCNNCHSSYGSPVTSEDCSGCHPSDDPGGCNIVDIHESSGFDCFSCHADHCDEDTDHIDTCLICHVVDDLHVNPGHGVCTQCHEVNHGGVIVRSVEPDKCTMCHPLGNPDKCGLANYHTVSCQGCHTECVGGGDTTTTTTTSESSSHIETCLVCHEVGNLGVGGETIHGDHTSGNCSDCHDGMPQAGNVEPSDCIVCHPIGNPGDCNLANLHDPGIGGNCLECHIDCDESPNSHIEECLVCHLPDDLHGISTHASNCARCHDGTPQSGNVQADACIVCHPIGNAGTCNLVSDHWSNCLTCHLECGTPTTTTTTAPSPHLDRCLVCHSLNDIHANGNHSDCQQCHDGGVSFNDCTVCHSGCTLPINHGSSCLGCHNECGTQTTTIPISTHLSCLTCHASGDLHAIENHSDCATCHQGDTAFGSCVECHAGCTVVAPHGGYCLQCHNECATETTTTTPNGGHIVAGAVDETNCLANCHTARFSAEGSLHSVPAHTNCMTCHEGETTTKGNVFASACATCHPPGNPGTCNLVNVHWTCFGCHTECGESTSTTTTIESISIEITNIPGTAVRSHLVPLPLIMFIRGKGTHFNRTTEVSFEGMAIWPPMRLLLSPDDLLFVFSIINPAGLQATGSSDVTVNVISRVDSGEGEPYEEVGSSTITLVVLPLL